MIHSERDLFSSVAFFAKRAEQRIYVRWLPFFSLHENLIWCYSADAAKGTTGVHKANGTHRAVFIYCADFNHSPNSPVIFVNERCNSVFCTFSASFSSTRPAKQLLMMSALHFRRLQHCISPTHPLCRERDEFRRGLWGGRWPHREPDKPSQGEIWAEDEENKWGNLVGS